MYAFKEKQKTKIALLFFFHFDDRNSQSFWDDPQPRI